MKVLFLCKYLSTGGAERVCVDVANELCRKGHEIIIITDTKKHFNYQPSPKIKLVHMEAAPRLTTPGMFMTIYRTLKHEQPDVVVSILYRYATISKIAAKMTCNCPVIASDHNSFERPKGYHMRFVQWLNKFYSNYYFDYLTVLTEADADFLEGRFKNVKVMQNPLAFRPVEITPPKEKVVLAVGRPDAWEVKGFDVLIKSWHIVGKQYPDWILKIVGSGSRESEVFMPHTENVIEEYQRAAIFVMSSRYEGFGLVLIEAMSQGCACVACDYKGRQAEIVKDGYDGLICQPGNVDQLAEKISYLIENKKIRELLQNTAPKSLERYSIENVTNRWEKLFQEVTKIK